MTTAVETGRRGEHIVAAFLISQGWQSSIVDAVGYDIVATQGKKIYRVQVKSSARARLEKASWYYGFSIGIGGHKKTKNPTRYYDVLALCAIDLNSIYFLPGKNVFKKTYRFRREVFFDARLSETSWRYCLATLP